MTTEKQVLAEAVAGLYETFSVYPLARKVEGCPCCVSAEDEAVLHLQPLRRMTAEHLSRYAFKSLTTWGDEDDFRHFLPRLLELTADPHQYDVDLDAITGKLEYAKWTQWPEPEQKAVRFYLLALWHLGLTLPPEEVLLGGYLGAIGLAEEDLAPYLELWQNTTSDAALNQLVIFVDSQLSLHKHKLTNWSGRREQMTQVVEWLGEIGLA